MNIAVLLAGGSGRRMGGPEPKQFIEVAGRSILEHSIRAFDRHPDIEHIIIVAHADYVERIRSIAAPYAKVGHVVPGGKERYDSTLAALDVCCQMQATDSCLHINLLIHDAVRPLVSQRIISDCLDALKHCRAVDVAVPCTDTIVEVDQSGQICHITPRSMLRNVQTPQCFDYEIIRQAYELGLQDPNFVTTDDCGVVHRYLPHEPIQVVDGDTTNIKVTYPADLLLAEQILSSSQS